MREKAPSPAFLGAEDRGRGPEVQAAPGRWGRAGKQTLPRGRGPEPALLPPCLWSRETRARPLNSELSSVVCEATRPVAISYAVLDANSAQAALRDQPCPGPRPGISVATRASVRPHAGTPVISGRTSPDSRHRAAASTPLPEAQDEGSGLTVSQTGLLVPISLCPPPPFPQGACPRKGSPFTQGRSQSLASPWPTARLAKPDSSAPQEHPERGRLPASAVPPWGPPGLLQGTPAGAPPPFPAAPLGPRAAQLAPARACARDAGRAALTFGVLVAQGGRPHVAEAQAALAAAVHEQVAVVRVELGRRDHLREVLHVGRLDVHDVWPGQGRHPRCSASPGLPGTCPAHLSTPRVSCRSVPKTPGQTPAPESP